MTEYRIHRLNGGGAIVSESYANCACDQDVLDLARRMASPDGEAEVWLGTRCVGRVSAWSMGFVAPTAPSRTEPLGSWSSHYTP